MQKFRPKFTRVNNNLKLQVYFNAVVSLHATMASFFVPLYPSSFHALLLSFLRTRQLFKVDSFLVMMHRSNHEVDNEKVDVQISSRWKNENRFKLRRIGVSSRFIFFLISFHLESLRGKIRSIKISKIYAIFRDQFAGKLEKKREREIRLRNEIQNKTFSKLNINIYIFSWKFSKFRFFFLYFQSTRDLRQWRNKKISTK